MRLRLGLSLRLRVLELIVVVELGLLVVAVRVGIEIVRCARVRLVMGMLMWMLGADIFNRAVRLVRGLEERHGYVVLWLDVKESRSPTSAVLDREDGSEGIWPEQGGQEKNGSKPCQLDERG